MRLNPGSCASYHSPAASSSSVAAG
jgi:hypothetical protein